MIDGPLPDGTGGEMAEGPLGIPAPSVRMPAAYWNRTSSGLPPPNARVVVWGAGGIGLSLVDGNGNWRRTTGGYRVDQPTYWMKPEPPE